MMLAMGVEIDDHMQRGSTVSRNLGPLLIDSKPQNAVLVSSQYAVSCELIPNRVLNPVDSATPLGPNDC